MERGYRKGFVCCNVVIFVAVTGWWKGRKMESVTERGFLCCNMVMCVVVMVWGEG
jgi:hypothetical protein